MRPSRSLSNLRNADRMTPLPPPASDVSCKTFAPMAVLPSVSGLRPEKTYSEKTYSSSASSAGE
eukprot:9377299-Heterocapsa_arctica.AAC.1